MGKIFNSIKKVSEVLNWISRWLLLILMVIICYDVFMRYVMNKPTIWVYDISYILGAFLVVFGFTSLHLDDGNTRVDVFYTKFSRKWQLIVDTLTNILLFGPAYIMLTREYIKNALKAFGTKEVITQSTWHPLMWPVKGIITVGYIIFIAAFVIKTVLIIIEFTSLSKEQRKGVIS